MPRATVWPPRINKNKGYDRVWIPKIGEQPGYWMTLGRTGTPGATQAYQRLLTEHPTAPSIARPAGDQVRNSLTVADLCVRFQTHYRTLKRITHTYYRIQSALNQLAELYGDLSVEEFKGPQLKAFQRSLASKGLSRSYISGIVGTVKQAWRHAVSEDWIDPALLQGLDAVASLEPGESGAVEPRVVEPAPLDDVQATLPHLRPPVRAMVELQLITGMRSGELCSLTPGQIIREGTFRVQGRGTVRVDQLGGAWVYAPDQHKTASQGHGRYVVLGPKAQAILLPWLDRAADLPCFSPAEDHAAQVAERSAARQTPLYPSHAAKRQATWESTRGDRYTSQSYQRAIARACEKAGVPHWHPHQLRHAAEVLIESEYGLDEARAVLGHRDPRMTARYGVRDVLTAAKVMSAIG